MIYVKRLALIGLFWTCGCVLPLLSQVTERPLLSTEEVGSMLAFEHVNAGAVKRYDGLLQRVESVDTSTATEEGVTGVIGQKKVLYRFNFDFESQVFCGVRKYTVEGTDFRNDRKGEKIRRSKLSAFFIDCREKEQAYLLYNGRRSVISTAGMDTRELVRNSGPVGLKDFRRYAIDDLGRFLVDSADSVEKGAENIAEAKWLDEKRYQIWSAPKKFRNGVETKQYLTFDVDMVMPVAKFSMVRSPGKDWQVAGFSNRRMAWEEINNVVLPISGKCVTNELFNLTGQRGGGIKCEVVREDKFHWFSVNNLGGLEKSLFTEENLDDQAFGLDRRFCL